MKRIKSISKCLLAILMIVAGTMHFMNPGFFLKIVPPYLPLHKELVLVSGVCEILLGVLLLKTACNQQMRLEPTSKSFHCSLCFMTHAESTKSPIQSMGQGQPSSLPNFEARSSSRTTTSSGCFIEPANLLTHFESVVILTAQSGKF